MTMIYMIVELIVAKITTSETLWADALHMLSDFLSMIIGFVAEHMKDQSAVLDKQLVEAQNNDDAVPARGGKGVSKQARITKTISKSSEKWKNLRKGVPPAKYTFSYHRAEVIGGFVNAIISLILMCQLVVEAISRLLSCPDPIREPQMLLITGFLGLLINIVGILLFTQFGMTHSHGGQACHGHGGHGHSHGSAPAKERADILAMENHQKESKLSHQHHHKNLKYSTTTNNKNKKFLNRCETSQNSATALLPSIGENNVSEPTYLLQNTNSVEDPKITSASKIYPIHEIQAHQNNPHHHQQIMHQINNNSGKNSKNSTNLATGNSTNQIKTKKPGRTKIKDSKKFFEKGEHYECEPLRGCNSHDVEEIRRCPVKPETHRHGHHGNRQYLLRNDSNDHGHIHSHSHNNDNNNINNVNLNRIDLITSEDEAEKVFIEENQLKNHSHQHSHDHVGHTPYDNETPGHRHSHLNNHAHTHSHSHSHDHDHNHNHSHEDMTLNDHGSCQHSHGARSRKKFWSRKKKKKDSHSHSHSHSQNHDTENKANHSHSHNHSHDHGHGHTHYNKNFDQNHSHGNKSDSCDHGHSHNNNDKKNSGNDNLNVRGVILHLVGDALGSVAVCVSAALHLLYGDSVSVPVEYPKGVDMKESHNDDDDHRDHDHDSNQKHQQQSEGNLDLHDSLRKTPATLNLTVNSPKINKINNQLSDSVDPDDKPNSFQDIISKLTEEAYNRQTRDFSSQNLNSMFLDAPLIDYNNNQEDDGNNFNFTDNNFWGLGMMS